jgi:hypothetical protein
MNSQFDDLAREFSQLRDHGHRLQQQGQFIVKIAESGASNIANYSTLYSEASAVLPETLDVKKAFYDFTKSGEFVVSELKSANQNLKSAANNLRESLFPALTGITFSNIAAQNLLECAIDNAPEEKRFIFQSLAEKPFKKPYSTEELDVLLDRFRKGLSARRRGAWDAFYSSSQDALPQAAHSMRDILALLVSQMGSNEMVLACAWFDRSKEPTLSDRVRLLLFGPSERHVETSEIVAATAEISEFVTEDGQLKQIAHGSKSFSRERTKISMEKTEELLYLILSQLAANQA